jgi:2-haloacid dehalogenase
VTGDALDFALETLAIERACLRERLMQLYLTLDALTEVPCVLDQLKAVGLRTAILSNGTPTMLQAAVDGAIQTPHQGLSDCRGPSVATGVGDRVPIVEFLGHHAAAAFGTHVVWCNRYGRRRGRLPGTPAAR